jgi:hypothetical protein
LALVAIAGSAQQVDVIPLQLLGRRDIYTASSRENPAESTHSGEGVYLNGELAGPWPGTVALTPGRHKIEVNDERVFYTIYLQVSDRRITILSVSYNLGNCVPEQSTSHLLDEWRSGAPKTIRVNDMLPARFFLPDPESLRFKPCYPPAAFIGFDPVAYSKARLESKPSGARVIAGKALLGFTPVTLVLSETGLHRLIVEKTGYYPSVLAVDTKRQDKFVTVLRPIRNRP